MTSHVRCRHGGKPCPMAFQAIPRPPVKQGHPVLLGWVIAISIVVILFGLAALVPAVTPW